METRKKNIIWIIKENDHESIYCVDFDDMETAWTGNPFDRYREYREINIEGLQKRGHRYAIYDGSIESYLLGKGFVVIGGSDVTGNLQFDKLENIKVYKSKNNDNYLSVYFPSGVHEKIRHGRERTYCRADDVMYDEIPAHFGFIPSFSENMTKDELSQKLKGEGWIELSSRETKFLIWEYIQEYR